MTMARPSFLGLLLIAPALSMIGALFLYPLGFSLAAAFTEPGGGLSLMHFQKAYRALFHGYSLHALHRRRFDAPDRPVLDYHCRHSDAQRNAMAGRCPAQSLPLAALHPFHRRGPMHADFPRQERSHEQFLRGARPDGTDPDHELPRLARHHHHLRLETGAFRDADAGRCDGLHRPRHDRSRAQSRRFTCCGC